MPKSDGQENDTWESIYCSVMLIIVAFFVFLVAISLRETEKMQAFQSQFQGKTDQSVRTALKTPAAAKKDEEQSKEGLIARLGDDLGRIIAQSGLGDGFLLERDRTGIKLRIPADVVFASGQSRLEEKAIPFLGKITSLAQKNNLVMRIEGHADNQPIRSVRYPSNWELSAARAISVLKYFQETGQIPAARLSAAGFGEHQPREGNETPEGRRSNRRVEIFFDLPQALRLPDDRPSGGK